MDGQMAGGLLYEYMDSSGSYIELFYTEDSKVLAQMGE